MWRKEETLIREKEVIAVLDEKQQLKALYLGLSQLAAIRQCLFSILCSLSGWVCLLKIISYGFR